MRTGAEQVSVGQQEQARVRRETVRHPCALGVRLPGCNIAGLVLFTICRVLHTVAEEFFIISICVFYRREML